MEPETSIMPKPRAASTAASLISGSMGGMAQVLVGQPLDTIKTRAQTAMPGQFKGPLDIATQTIKKEGFFALYKGTRIVRRLIKRTQLMTALGLSRLSVVSRNGESSDRNRRSQLAPLRVEQLRSQTRFSLPGPDHSADHAGGIHGRSSASSAGEPCRDVQGESARSVFSTEQNRNRSPVLRCECKRTSRPRRSDSRTSLGRCTKNTAGSKVSCGDTG